MFNKLVSRVGRRPPDKKVDAIQPFAEHDEEHYFAGDADRVQRLDLLAHLVPSGGVLLVIGESGVGKTTYLRQLIPKISGSCRICQLSASASIDPQQTMRELLDCFAWQANVVAGVGGAQLRILQEHFGLLRRNGYTPVVVVDDAEALPDSVLGVLEQLFDADNRNLLALILVGDASLKKRITAPLRRLLNANVSHELVLAPFSVQEQRDYIHQRLQWAGIDEMGPFHSSALKFIYVASRGMPRRTNQLARVFWADKNSGNLTGKASSWHGLRWPRLRGAGLQQLRYIIPLLFVSSSAAIYHVEIRSALFPPATEPTLALKGDASAGIDNELLLVKRNEAPVVKSVVDGDGKGSVIQEQSLRLGRSNKANLDDLVRSKVSVEETQKMMSAGGLGTMPELITTLNVQPLIATQAVTALKQSAGLAMSTRLNNNANENSLVNSSNNSVRAGFDVPAIQVPRKEPDVMVGALADEANMAQQLLKQLRQNLSIDSAREVDKESRQHTALSAVVVVEQPAKVEARKIASALRNNDWWLDQPAGQFAVQLMAMEESVARQYIERNDLAGRVAVFSVQGKKEQGLMAIASGPFLTQSAATDAARMLQQQLTDIKPWVRSVSSIQKAVVDFQRSNKPYWNSLVKKHEQQLLQGSAQDYVVQLMAMDRQAVTQFVTKNRLADQVMYFRTRSGAQELVAAVLGSYTSRQQALNAGHDIAGKARGVRPWVRSLASVQKIIRSQTDRPH